MADSNKPDGANAGPIVISGQYIKDLSFEAPGAPTIFAKLQNNQPELNVSVDLGVAKMDGTDNTYEVTIVLGAEMKVGGEIGFVLELKYAGVFTLNIAEEHIGAALMIECPRLLFPYARNIISDVTRDGGFVPLTLQPIDFVALYQKRQENLGQEDQPTANA